MASQHTAELTPLIVYYGNMPVGYGYILIRSDGMQSIPVVTDNYDNPLPMEWVMLEPVIEKRRLVVVAETLQ